MTPDGIDGGGAANASSIGRELGGWRGIGMKECLGRTVTRPSNHDNFFINISVPQMMNVLPAGKVAVGRAQRFHVEGWN